MVMRDQGPRKTLPYGVQSNNLPMRSETPMGSPDAGLIAEYLEDKPALKFISVAVGTLVAAATAGGIVRGAGKRGISLAAQRAAIQGPESLYARSLQSFRNAQKTLDELEGIEVRRQGRRQLDDGTWYDDPSLDAVRLRRDFLLTHEEHMQAAETGIDSLAEWSTRDAMQSNLVRQARRLPYELTGAYVTQRAILDPLLGNEKDNNVNWSNPLSVIGDFAEQSAKNLAFAFVPFEAGRGALQNTWRRAMTGQATSNFFGVGGTGRNILVDANQSLNLLGHEFTDLIAKSVRYSRQTTGAASHAIVDTARKQRSLVETLDTAARSDKSFSQFAREWWNRARQGQEVVGPIYQMRHLSRTFKEDLGRRQREGIDETLTTTFHATGDSMFERLVSSVNKLKYAGQKFDEDTFRHGDFYREYARKEHNKFVRNNLLRQGVDEDVADAFLSHARISTPFRRGQRSHMSNRIGFGKGALADDWLDDLHSRLDASVGGRGADSITANIDRAMQQADDQYFAARESIDRSARQTWQEVYGQIGRQSRSMLGTRQAAYADFGPGMTSSAQEFLVRRSAQRMGVSLIDESGEAISTSRLRTAIRSEGMDPGNTAHLKSFLMQRGDISKPWNPLGTNMFGLSPLTVGDATRGKYFEGNKDAEDFLRTLRQSDWDSYAFNNIKLGGMYRTSRGEILNLNPIKRGSQLFRSKISEELQIPFIHVKPLQLLSRDTDRDLIKLSMGKNNPFLPRDYQGADAYLWMRQGRKSGSLSRIDIGPNESVTSSVIPGRYRALDSSSQTFFGKNLRLAYGETGRYPYQPNDTSKPLGWIKGKLNWDQHQPDSLFGFVRRAVKHRRDINNPANFARHLRGANWRRTELPHGPEEIVQAADNLFQFWHKQAFGPNVMRRVMDHADDYPALRGLFDPFEQGAGGLAGKSNVEIHRMIKTKFHSDFAENLDPMTRATLSRARNSLLKRWANVEDPHELGRTLSAARRTGGLDKAVDEARMDLMRYMALEHGMTAGGVSGYLSRSGQFLDELDDMVSSGLVSTKEAAEARTAIAGLNQIFVTAKRYDIEIGRTTRTLGALDDLLEDPGMRRLFGETADYTTEGATQRAGRRVLGGGEPFGVSDYQYAGVELNPLGNNPAFVQTFGTAFDRSPMRTLSSALGLTTYRDPENLTVGGLGSSHLVSRMNEAMGTLGMRLDETAYAGPVDMLGRGLVGQRVLPLVAAGSTFMALDRTLGAYTKNERDAQGERVYSPLIVGGLANIAMSAQVAAAGLIPGGMTADEKHFQLTEGEVPVKRGRWWPLGSTPWEGGQTEYYRPSWYRQIQSGHLYTSQTYGTPLERLMYGYDFSPLRPFDPYRFEREHGMDRPYPVSGDYFTGPWGPVTPALNMTVGKLLKPRQMMHQEEMQAALAEARSVGQFGVSFQGAGGGGAFGPATRSEGLVAASQGGPAYMSGSALAGETTVQDNERLIAASGTPNTVASQTAFPYVPRSGEPFASPRSPMNVMAMSQPIDPSGIGNQVNELAYRTQEFAGIYGFAFGAMKERLGLGSMEYESLRPTLAQAGTAYGSGRQFWDMNLGGMGDFPLPFEGEYANLELSEIIRRFIPKPRRQNTINPLMNTLGQEQPWLPGEEYFLDFTRGDPFAKIPMGEMRLPGQGYERFNTLHPDETGQYGLLDQLKILGDVAPYSNQFRRVQAELQRRSMTAEERLIFEDTMAKVRDVQQQHDFTPYEQQDHAPYDPRRILENLGHMDTWFNRKFAPNRTALEDWERSYVYGRTFQRWSHPIEDFAKPMAQKAAGLRDPFESAVAFGIVGHLMGVSRQAKSVGRLVGGMAGFGISAVSEVGETVKGERYIPEDYKRTVALEEYVDILEYTRALRGQRLAQQAGNAEVAQQFQSQMQRTMYGIDPYTSTPEQLAQALPKRKREHFLSMLQAPVEDRPDILKYAGRLERRMYQAQWGMRVEAKPTLEEFFADRELPDPGWEGWDPRVDMDWVMIKMLQHEGLNMSQAGYYPQQVEEANIINPSYPDFNTGTSNSIAQIEALMEMHNVSGSVRMIPTPYSGTSVNISGF